MSQNVGFCVFDKEGASDNVKYKTKEILPKKVLVWLGLSSKGISTPFIGTTKGPALTSSIYINRCLSKLGSSIEHYAGDEYRFWPGLASSHHANETTQWLLQEKIKFVAKQANRANVPIAHFWSILADKVYERCWEGKTELQLKRRIYQKIKQIDMKIIQHMMMNTRTKLRKIKDQFL